MTRKSEKRALVTGAGGFIGHHLVKLLKRERFWVRGVDIKKPEFESSPADEFVIADLREITSCRRAVKGVEDVYQLAADMGGIGYITSKFASLARNNVLINSNMLEAAKEEGVNRYLYASSACIYPGYLQKSEDVAPLKESDAIPADPERGYGWEKLFTEQLVEYYRDDYGLDTRTVRFHNIYGPQGAYQGGREKAPAAICRKVAEAEQGSGVEVWGDGKQTRSFCFVGDCVEGMTRLMESGFADPVNLGTDELVTLDHLVDLVADVAGKALLKSYDPTKPQGVRGRNSDNSLLRKVLRWEPQVSLRQGLSATYPWIWGQLDRQGRARPPAPKATLETPAAKAHA